jgi:hypothetical protein
MAVAVAVELMPTIINAQTPMPAQGGSAAGELEALMAIPVDLSALTLLRQPVRPTQAEAVEELTQRISTLETVDPE